MTQDCHGKTEEKRSSMASHCNFFLAIMKAKIRKNEMKGRIIDDFRDITWEDLDSGSVVGEWAAYLQNVAKKMMSAKGDPISYGTATGYMSAFKCSLIDKFHKKGVPTQFQSGIWSRMLGKIRQAKFEYATKNNQRMFGSKEAASPEDKKGLVALVLWKGSVENAEFMMLFNSMTSNCGRGSEIAILQWSSCKLKKIQEQNGLDYETLSQYVVRTKTQGMSTIFSSNFYY